MTLASTTEYGWMIEAWDSNFEDELIENGERFLDAMAK